MTPEAREKEIAELGQEIIELLAEGRKQQAQICFHTLASLLAGRDEETVKKMEREQGLDR